MLDSLSAFLREKVQLPPSGPFLVPAIFLVSLGGSLLSTGKTRSLAVTAVLGYLLSELRHPTGDMIQDALLPMQGLILFAHWCDFYVLHDPEKEYWMLRDGKGEDKLKGTEEKDQNERTMGEKGLGWHFDLTTSMRGVGWNWKVKNLPPTPTSTKWAFVRTQLAKAFLFYFLFDFIWYSIQDIAYPLPLSSTTIPKQILWTWIPGFESYYSLNMQYPLFATLTVALGFCSPEGWPPIMGNLRDVTCVKDFWGRFWHQGLRRPLSIPFQVLTKVVSIRKGSLASRYSQLYLAFAASAFLHHFPSLIHGRGREASDLNQLAYFLVQPLAITGEDFVIYLGNRSGVKESWKTRALGRIWTFSWFCYCLRLVFEYNIVALSKPIMPSICGAFVGLAGRWLKSGSAAGGRDL